MVQCTQCSQYFNSYPASVWDPSAGLGNSGSSHPSICDKCKAENLRRKAVAENKKLEKQIKELESSLQFLRHKFVNGPSLGIRDGGILIIVQGATDQPLEAHKFILASRSPVFQKIFETYVHEKEKGILRMDDATLPVVRAVIKFCYNAEIEFTDEVTSEAVLEVSHKYRIHHLRRLCEKDLTATIGEGNLPKRLKLARKFESTSLEAAASQFFKDNFDEVIGDVLSAFC